MEITLGYSVQLITNTIYFYESRAVDHLEEKNRNRNRENLSAAEWLLKCIDTSITNPDHIVMFIN